MEELSFLEVINTAWPILAGMASIIIAFAQLFNRVQVLEEKVKTLFDLVNQKNKG